MNAVKEQLEAELLEAERDLKKLDKQLADRPEFGLGEGSTGAHSWEMTLARRERVTNHIKAIQIALERVGDGTYGCCEQCGAQIDPERLEILPTTPVCVACAQTEDVGVL